MEGAKARQVWLGGLTSLCSPAPNSEPPSERPNKGEELLSTDLWGQCCGGRETYPAMPPVTDISYLGGVILTQLGTSLAPPHRPSLACSQLLALDAFAQENIYALYKFNFSASGDAPFAEDPGREPAFQLDRAVDRAIRLQRLSSPGSQNKVGFRLVSVRLCCWPAGR